MTYIGDAQMDQVNSSYEIGHLSLFRWKVHQVKFSRDSFGDNLATHLVTSIIRSGESNDESDSLEE